MYNSADFIEPCLRSLARMTWPNLEVVIADNGSRDESLQAAHSATDETGLAANIFHLQQNLGCAGGNNAAWRRSTGDYLVFLNPDTEVDPDFVTELVRPLIEDETIGITGAKMYYPPKDKGILQHAGGLVHPNGMTNHYGNRQRDAGQFDEQRDVDYVTGAGLAIRRELMEEVGGFDPEYFPAYYEEVDLCWKVRKRGKRVVYVPRAVLVHHESVALGPGSLPLRRLYAKMRIQFLLKNQSLGHLMKHAIPNEIRWMLKQPEARGNRRVQVGAYLANLPYLWRKLTGGNRRRKSS